MRALLNTMTRSALAFLTFHASAHAIEITGLTGYHLSSPSPKDPSHLSTKGGVGYGFFTRFELAYGALESGLLFTPVSTTFSVGTNEVRAGGSYWILPVIFRIPLFSPFLSIGFGPDFGVRGGTSFTIQGTSLASAPASGFRSHFGAQVSLQATQELGDHLGAVLDLRFRQGIGPAISVQSTTSTLSTTQISLGIQKRLD
jgi:hypothetical protein